MILDLVLVSLGFLFSLTFLYISTPYWISDAAWYIKLTLSFFIASFIFSALGMITEARSRAGGFFLLAVFLPFIYNFYYNGFLRTDGFVFGMLEGIFFSLYSYFNNRFDKLASYLRRFIFLFSAFTSAYLILTVSAITSDASPREAQDFLANGSNDSFKVMLLIGILFTLCIILSKFVCGIRAYDVFVYGPSRSGKTLLMLAFYNQFINFLGGRRKEIIVSDKNMENLKIENMLMKIEKGELPKSNLRTDLAIYSLSGKKDFKPVEMTFVDYGGELTNDFSSKYYEEIIEDLSKRFNATELKTLKQNLSNVDFITYLRDNYKNEFAHSVEKIAFAYVYRRFESAGKIIFLVDGDYVATYHNGGRDELTRLFGHYANIINLFGKEKSYSIVVTKIDQYKDLSKIIENSEEAESIEREIYDLFCEITTFKEIMNMASQMPIYMYTVSVDATMKPLTMKSGSSEDDLKRLKINPWRVGEIGKFSF
jgi:hypothetical protein